MEDSRPGGYPFQDWFRCPECDEQERVSMLPHKTEIIFECHECETISEFVIGEDIPLQNLDFDDIEDRTDDGRTD
jgi:transcription elongation factor Elf1